MAETVAAGASPADARKWWLGELARRANEAGTELADLAITPAQVARIAELVAAGTLNDGLARQVIDGVLVGEGSPDEVVAARGLAVVSDEGALTKAIDEAIAANPDVVAKIRDGKVAAAGVLVGAVMKATGGKADAARVRELILQRLSSELIPICRAETVSRANPAAAETGARRRGRATAGAGAGATGRTRHFGPNEEGWGPRSSAERAARRTATRAAISSGVASPRTTRSSGRLGG